MELGLSGKTAAVLGASKGIGRAIAAGFAREHCHIAVVARSEELLRAMGPELLEAGAASFRYFGRDAVNGSPKALAQEILESCGTPDVVIHSIGSSMVSRDPLSDAGEWEYALRYNALAAIDMNSVFLPAMLARGSGKVIHISSISAVALRGNPLYASAKAFLNAYVTTTGRQLAQRGVALCSIMPGAVSFPGSYWDELIREGHPQVKDFLRHHQAAGRFGTPEEIADMAVFLASERAAFLYGANIPVDGGSM